ncbi:MAG: hypothetical protein HY619_03615 [Thaumarchaeota archaeon]|nr:hypothetical protein [Nitrososphaerota archaeon]
MGIKGGDGSTEKPQSVDDFFPRLISRLQVATKRSASDTEEMKEVDIYIKHLLTAKANELSGKIELIRSHSILEPDKQNLDILDLAIQQLAKNLRQSKHTYTGLVKRRGKVNSHKLNKLLDTDTELFTTLSTIGTSLARYSKAGATPKRQLEDFLDAIGEARQLLVVRNRMVKTSGAIS